MDIIAQCYAQIGTNGMSRGAPIWTYSEFDVTGKSVFALRNLLPSLALLCFAIGAASPTGFMPGSVSAGTPFVLCPVQNPVLAEMLSSKKSSSAHHHEHAEDSASTSATDKCSFASAATTFLATNIVLAAVTSNVLVIAPFDTEPIAHSVLTSSRSARGPPAAATI